VFSFALCVQRASAQQSASVTVTLSINDDGSGDYTPGDYAVYATDSTADGNQGIYLYSINVALDQKTTTLVNESPELSYQLNGSLYQLGFQYLRSPPAT